MFNANTCTYYSTTLDQQHIPDTWDNVEEFRDWYVANGMPFHPPIDFEVFTSDDATSVSLFRKGQFQVELYLVHPDPWVPTHSHPGVNLIKVDVRGVTPSGIFGGSYGVLKSGGMHGVGGKSDENTHGFMLIAIQQWHPDLTPTTVAARWIGKTAGPKHESIIRRFNPDALIINGYADVTRKMNDTIKEVLHG